MGRLKRKAIRKEILKHSILWTTILFAFAPLYLMLNISLKDNQQFSSNPWLPEAPFHFENYIAAWNMLGFSIFNTTFVALTTVFIMIILAVIGGFFFARYKMPGSNFLFFFFLLLLMYPGVANMVPTFKLITSIGLYNSHWALILLGISGGQAMVIYILKNFIEEIPKDLFEAATIDG